MVLYQLEAGMAAALGSLLTSHTAIDPQSISLAITSVSCFSKRRAQFFIANDLMMLTDVYMILFCSAVLRRACIQTLRVDLWLNGQTSATLPSQLEMRPRRQQSVAVLSPEYSGVL